MRSAGRVTKTRPPRPCSLKLVCLLDPLATAAAAAAAAAAIVVLLKVGKPQPTKTSSR